MSAAVLARNVVVQGYQDARKKMPRPMNFWFC
jgi:hypothetical protein